MAKGYLAQLSGSGGGGAGGGLVAKVNGDPASTAEVNFNDLTPQAPLDGVINVLWQKDPDDIHISAYVPAREDLPFFGSSIIGRSNIDTIATLDIIPYGPISGTIEIIVPVGGWLRSLHVWMDTAMNAAHTKQVRAIKDTQLTALNMSITPGSPAGVYGQIRSALRINQGEQFRFDLASIGTASAGVVQGIGCEFATDDGSTMIGGCPNTTVPLSSSAYVAFFASVLTATESLVEWKCPIAGTVRNLVLRTRNPQPSTGSLVCTIRKNGAGQAVTITIPASGVVGIYGDFTSSFSVSPGDTLSLEFANNATSVSTIIYWWAFTILPDASARTTVLGGYANGIFTTSGNACGLFNNTSPPSTALDDHDVPLTRPGRLRNLYLRTTAAAGAGLTLATYEIYVNGAASGLLVSHGASAAAGWFSDLTNVVDVVRGDRIRLQGTLTGANGPNVGSWGLEFLGSSSTVIFSEVEFSFGAPGDSDIPHGFVATPQALGIVMTSDGAIWMQIPESDGTDFKLTASSSGVTGKVVVVPAVLTVYEIELAPGTGGNFAVAHGLAGTPQILGIKMTSDGAVWTQTPEADGTNLNLTASSGGITGKAVVALATPSTIYEIDLTPGAGGNFNVAHGLGGTPQILGIVMTSDGAIWAQAPEADGTNLKLTASSGGITGKAVVAL